MKTLVAAMCMLLLVGCASRQKQTENLLETSVRFQEGLRWSRWEDAASHVPPEEREAFLDEHDELGEDLRIDDYEVIRVHFKDSHEEAMVQVKYTWHLDGEGIVKETVTDQRWELHGSAWWMEEEVHKRGDDMPGIGPKDKDGGKDGAKGRKPAQPKPKAVPAAGGNASGDAAM